MFPVRVIQGLQRAVHINVLGRILGTTAQMEAPFALRLLGRCPRLQRIPARFVGLGIRLAQGYLLGRPGSLPG